MSAATMFDELEHAAGPMHVAWVDRRRRDARTHTLHGPASWKVQHLGRYAVDGTLPTDHGRL